MSQPKTNLVYLIRKVAPYTILILGALTPMALSMLVITSQQRVRFVETFKKYSSTRTAGISFKLPRPIQTATSNFSLQITEIEKDIGVKSSDNAFVIVPIRVQYRVLESAADQAFYLLENAEQKITSYIVNQVRATAAGMTFNNLFSAKVAFEQDVLETLTERLGAYDFSIENVLVDDPQPSDELRAAFDRFLAAKRLKDAAQNEGEAVKIKAVLEAR